MIDGVRQSKRTKSLVFLAADLSKTDLGEMFQIARKVSILLEDIRIVEMRLLSATPDGIACFRRRTAYVREICVYAFSKFNHIVCMAIYGNCY